MAIQTRIINDLYTEIYVGGGNFITQSAPTNFHQFYTRKILTESESIDDFREVTEAEKTALEESDARWKEPSDELIEQAEVAGAVYNRETGYFELNELYDITAEQMRVILKTYNGNKTTLQVPITLENDSARTNVAIKVYTLGAKIMVSGANYETIAINSTHKDGQTILFPWSLSNMPKLRKVIGRLNFTDSMNCLMGNNFVYVRNLEDVTIRTQVSIKLSECPKLSYSSIEYIVTNAANTKPITITLHPDAYARVTEEIFAAAAEKNITIAST